MERESLCWFYMVVLGVLIITLNLCAPYLTSDKLSSTINWAVVNLIGQTTLVCGRLSVLLRNYGKSGKHLAYRWYICYESSRIFLEPEMFVSPVLQAGVQRAAALCWGRGVPEILFFPFAPPESANTTQIMTLL